MHVKRAAAHVGGHGDVGYPRAVVTATGEDVSGRAPQQLPRVSAAVTPAMRPKSAELKNCSFPCQQRAGSRAPCLRATPGRRAAPLSVCTVRVRFTRPPGHARHDEGMTDTYWLPAQPSSTTVRSLVLRAGTGTVRRAGIRAGRHARDRGTGQRDPGSGFPAFRHEGQPVSRGRLPAVLRLHGRLPPALAVQKAILLLLLGGKVGRSNSRNTNG